MTNPDTREALADELLPCPFCGSPARTDMLPHAGGPGWVECSFCECDQHMSDTLEEAVSKWNTRAGSGRLLLGTSGCGTHGCNDPKCTYGSEPAPTLNSGADREAIAQIIADEQPSACVVPVADCGKNCHCIAAAKKILSLPRAVDGGAVDWPPPFEMMKLQCRAADGGDWIDIYPAQIAQMQRQGCDIRALAPLDGPLPRVSTGGAAGEPVASDCEAYRALPCPFCDSEIRHAESWARSFDPPRLYHEWHHVEDNDCWIARQHKIVARADGTGELQEVALRRWNDRAASPLPLGEVGREAEPEGAPGSGNTP